MVVASAPAMIVSPPVWRQAILSAQTHLTASQRADILDLMAGLSLSYIGKADDRKGRQGDAYTAEAVTPNGQRTQFLVIIESQTGALLDYERTLLHPAPGQSIQTPAVIQYRLYITSPTYATPQQTRCGH